MPSPGGSVATAAGRARGVLGLGLLLSIGLAPGCATKKDAKLLRDEVVRLQVRQDSLFREMQRQNRLLLDTLRTSFDMQRDAQGQTSHRFLQLEQQLGRTEEMINQLQVLVAQLTDRLDRQSAANAGPALGGTGVVAGEAAEAYQAGMTKMQEGAYTTARAAFQYFLDRFPADPLAPDAQYQIAETYAAEANAGRAISEFEKVEAQWPRSERAPGALLRAGILSEEGGDRARARIFYDQVRQRYPASEEAREAERRVRAIRG